MSAPPTSEQRRRVESARWKTAHPCPKCGHHDWCRARDDGAVLCFRRCGDDDGGRRIECSDGNVGWLYGGTEGDTSAPVNDEPPVKVAPPERCDMIYRALLTACPLSARHLAQLHARGLTTEEVVALGYGTRGEEDPVPGLFRALGGRRPLDDVPGFYQGRDRDYRLSGVPGMLIPMRDAQGRIHRMAVRVDDPGTGGKYRRVSTPEGMPGVGSGQHAHIALCTEEQRAAIRAGAPVRITEGEIKADIAALRTRVPTISIPGVGGWKRGVEMLGELGAKRVRVAYDADASINAAVARSLRFLVAALSDAGMVVDVETWPTTVGPDGKPQPKGIDDALAADVPITVHEGTDALDAAMMIISQGGAQPDPVADAVLVVQRAIEAVRQKRTTPQDVLEDRAVIDAVAVVLDGAEDRWPALRERLKAVKVAPKALQDAATVILRQRERAAAVAGLRQKAAEARSRVVAATMPVERARAALTSACDRIRSAQTPASVASVVLIESVLLDAGVALLAADPEGWPRVLADLQSAGAGDVVRGKYDSAVRAEHDRRNGPVAADDADDADDDASVPISRDLTAYTERDATRRLVPLAVGCLRFTTEGDGTGTWYAWDGRQWKRNARDTARRLAFEVADSMVEDLATDLESEAVKFEEAVGIARDVLSTRFADAVVRQAQTATELVVHPDAWDADPWVLNVANGLLDLRTLELRRHDPAALCTKLAPVPWDPEAAAPTWERFLSEAQPDDELRGFLQRVAGYSATGVVRDHILPVHWGRGRNGKGTYHNALMHVLGSYARQIPAEMLMETRGDRHPAERMTLLGTRFAVASEVEEGRAMNVSMVKTLTGGDPIPGRGMGAEWMTIRPTAKLSLQQNPRPRVREHTEAIWNRIKVISWPVSFAGREDTTLGDRLVAEASGILRWIVDGCTAWQRDGLRTPQSVAAESDELREENDPLGTFLEERAREQVGARAFNDDVHRLYREWCAARGAQPMSQTALTQALVERGWQRSKIAGRRYFRNWRILGNTEARAERYEAERVEAAREVGADEGHVGHISALPGSDLTREKNSDPDPENPLYRAPDLGGVGNCPNRPTGAPAPEGAVDAPPPVVPPTTVQTASANPCATGGCPNPAADGGVYCTPCTDPRAGADRALAAAENLGAVVDVVRAHRQTAARDGWRHDLAALAIARVSALTGCADARGLLREAVASADAAAPPDALPPASSRPCASDGCPYPALTGDSWCAGCAGGDGGGVSFGDLAL